MFEGCLCFCTSGLTVFFVWGKLWCHCMCISDYNFVWYPGVMKHVGGVTMVSWNVRGMGHPIKRAKVFSHLKSLSADIAFLQETHIRPSERNRLHCR